MNYLKHFSIYSFKWQLKGLVVITVYTIVSFLIMETRPDWIQFVGMMLFYVLLLYSMLSISLFSGISSHPNNMGDSFSGKYLQSLPMSKLELILTIALSNIYILIPSIASLVWLTVRWENYKGHVFTKDVVFSNWPRDNFFSLLTALFLAYFIMIFLQLLAAIEYPRRMYGKGSISNVFLSIRTFVRFVIGILFFTVVAATSSIFKTSFPILAAMFIFAVYLVIRTYNVILKEELSYWNWKRDILSIIVYCIMAFAGFRALVYFELKEGSVRTSDWRKFYAQGPEIFQQVNAGKWDKVKEYLKVHGDLSLQNEHGVSLIHALAIKGVSHDKILEDQFLRDKKNLNLLIQTSGKTCPSAFYCHELSIFHILACGCSDKSELFEKALQKVPEGISYKDVQGKTPLHYAASSCGYKTTSVLLNRGADFDIQDNEGKTPLMLASENDCPIVVAFLLKKGASPSVKDKNGKTALEYVQKYNNNGIAFWLKYWAN